MTAAEEYLLSVLGEKTPPKHRMIQSFEDLAELMEEYAQQQCQKRDELIKVQDEYITYLMKLVRTNNMIWDISLGARQDYEKEIEQLKKEIQFGKPT